MLKVEISDLRIKNKDELLSDARFCVEKNMVYTILGANGSGKTTLIKSLTGLLDERFYSVSGKVIFEGKNLFELDQQELRQIRKNKIKYLFQDAINSFDHLKNFGYYFNLLVINKNEIDPLLEYFFLPKSKELLKLYPYEVSGGMAQRINFVLTLLTHPQLLILDEPTSGIDLAISNLFLLKLKEFVGESENAALLVTHDIVFANKVSDKIAFLSKGKLTEFYTPEEFFKVTNYSELENFLNSHNQLTA
jgi:ABC-type glutathione transport system ATPase component